MNACMYAIYCICQCTVHVCSCTPPVAAFLISFFHLLPAEDLCLFIVSLIPVWGVKKNGKQDVVMLLNTNLELVDFRFLICELFNIECHVRLIWVWDLQLIDMNTK